MPKNCYRKPARKCTRASLKFYTKLKLYLALEH